MVEVFTVLECVNILSELCLQTKTPFSSQELRTLKDIITTLSHTDSSNIIYSWFKLQGDLPLECLWQLQSHNLLQFTTYIYYNADQVECLSNRFEEQIWCADEAVQREASETVAGLLAVLVNLGPLTPLEVSRPGQQLLSLVLQKFVARLMRDCLSCEKPVPFLSLLVHNSSSVTSRLHWFCLSLMREMIMSMSEAVTLEEAVQNVASEYTCAKSSLTILQVFREIITNIPAEDIVNEVSKIILSQEEFSWRWLLTSVSVFAASSAEGVHIIKDAIEKWVTQGSAGKNTRLLSTSLLIARQCCAENAPKFGLYSAWFGSLHLRPASAFTFFFNFLSELVPYEPVLYLKIHINKVPSVPANCNSVVADYASLAKTRLADLNQTTDYVGLFGEYTTTEQEGREADVVKVIAHFKKTKEVMKIVLEASVFRRQFYEKVFLPELLKDGNPDRVEFIEKLYKIGKIPHGLYNRWQQLHTLQHS